MTQNQKNVELLEEAGFIHDGARCQWELWNKAQNPEAPIITIEDRQLRELATEFIEELTESVGKRREAAAV